MNALRVAGTRLAALVRKDELEQELNKELRFHLMMRAREHAGAGMRATEASLQAHRRFGNVNAIKDACRDFSGGGLLEVLLADIRFAWRMLAKDRAFTAMAAQVTSRCSWPWRSSSRPLFSWPAGYRRGARQISILCARWGRVDLSQTPALQ